MISQQAIFLSQEHYLDLRQEAEQERFLQAAGLSRPNGGIQIGKVLEMIRHNFRLFQGFPEAIVLAKRMG
jgi:hypothetical protein